MAAFTLAHLSDPHLPPLPKARLIDLAGKRALGHLNWTRNRHKYQRRDVLDILVSDMQAQGPDHVAVTGDLVNLALEAVFAPALSWLESVGAADRVTMVPGNHDAYVRGAARQPELHWGDYMRGDGASRMHGFPFVRRRGPVALIGLSSAVPTAPFLATGKLGAEQLQRLAPLLDRSREEGLFRVVMIHHPPVSKSHFKRLTDGAAFRDLLAQHGAELVIHGHDHAHSVMWLDGSGARIPAVGVPSASEAPPGKHDSAGYNLYTIGGRAGGWRCELSARGLAPNGDDVVERNRMLLAGG
jgi:3',5'-cyclic AMP phosphodiesterase CpdA